MRTDNAEIQKTIRDSCKQLYTNKMDNLQETNKNLRKIQSPKTEPRRNRKYEQINRKHYD